MNQSLLSPLRFLVYGITKVLHSEDEAFWGQQLQTLKRDEVQNQSASAIKEGANLTHFVSAVSMIQ